MLYGFLTELPCLQMFVLFEKNTITYLLGKKNLQIYTSFYFLGILRKQEIIQSARFISFLKYASLPACLLHPARLLDRQG